ncbi:hypothetical protein KKB44_04790 [Candidatus Micrarchaeota archaeon]|nr:hypothetical protein [Candidatus Micrarchaeota archaeon]
MKDDKITVDEPLISTDVDNLIRTIAEKKKIALNDLRNLCQIGKKNMDKWLTVLEEEGYISVEYGLRGTYIYWKGLEDLSKEYETQTISEQAEVEETIVEDLPEEPSNDFSSEMPLEEDEEFNPEELLSDYIERKRSGDSYSDDIKLSILTRLGEKEDQPKAPITEPESEEPPAELDDQVSEPEDKITTETLKPTRGVVLSDVRDLMTSYLEEINKEKTQIEMLKKEKEALYRENLAVLEGRMQADLVSFSESIIEKQTQLAELKEHVLELPDKVDEVESLHRQMERLKEEGNRALKRTREKSQEYLNGIEQSKEELAGRIGELHSSMEEQHAQLDNLEKLGGSLENRAEKLATAVEDAKIKVDELHAEMSTVMVDLKEVQETRTKITEIKDEIRETVASHEDELQSLEAELEGISNAEYWVQEYVRDYETKIGEIEQYVAQSAEELAELREAAESLYLKKYLTELENMSDAYEAGLEGAVAKEKDIDSEIMKSKEKIAQLVRESQEMITKIRGDVADSRDFDPVLSRVKQKTQKVKTIVEEKRSERQKLKEEARSTKPKKKNPKKKKKK